MAYNRLISSNGHGEPSSDGAHSRLVSDTQGMADNGYGQEYEGRSVKPPSDIEIRLQVLDERMVRMEEAIRRLESALLDRKPQGE
jgi:hypothetical protein